MNRQTLIIILSLLIVGGVTTYGWKLSSESPKNHVASEIPLYRDGNYIATSTYRTPLGKPHELSVSITIENNIVTETFVRYDGQTIDAISQNPTSSTGHQRRFDEAYPAQVSGAALYDIKLSRVGGASLTTAAFNAAIEQIEAIATIVVE